MATYTQRGQAIGDALINGTATTTQLGRLGKALANSTNKLPEYTAGDNTVKARIFVEAFRLYCINAVKQYEAAEAMLAAQATADAAVDTGFIEN